MLLFPHLLATEGFSARKQAQSLLAALQNLLNLCVN